MLGAFSGAERNTRQELTKRPSAATSGYLDRLERNVCAVVGIPRELVIPLVPVGSIANKPVPRCPDRRSYRSHARDADKRRNIAKGGHR
jgi:hypothetical protein